MSDATPAPATDLGGRTIRGLKWTYGGTVVHAAMQVVYTAVMSRLLDPQEFGLFAIGTMTIVFSQFFANMGVGLALIQKPDLTETDVRAGWTSMLVLGAVLTVLLWAGAPLVADLFRDPAARDVIRVFSLQFLLLGFGNTSLSLLRRELRFREATTITVTAFAVGYLAVGIPLGFLGAGVWSLVAATLTSNTVGSVLRYAVVRHPLRPTFRLDAFRPLYAYGARATVGQFTEYLGNNLDTFAVGRFAATALLGQYNRAFYLVNLPLSYLVNAISTVLFPSYARIQDDVARLREVYVRSVAAAGSLLVPIALGFGVAAPEAVAVMLGPQWDEAARLVPLLAVAGAARVTTRFALIAADARAALNLRIGIQVAHIAFLAALLWSVAGGPLWHFALALTVAEVTRFVVYLVAMRWVVGAELQDLVRAFLPVAVAAVNVVLAVSAVRFVARAIGLPPVPLFILDGLVGAVTLGATMRTEPLWLVRREISTRLRTGQLVRPGSVSARVLRAVLGPPEQLVIRLTGTGGARP